MNETKCYCVVSIRQLLEALAKAQEPSSYGSKSVTISNCVVLEGVAVGRHNEMNEMGLQFDVRKIRRV